MSTKIVIIDPGHGGSDSGAIGNGVVEKVANLNTALALRSYLEHAGIKVFMTRISDVFVSLDARTNMANNIAAQYPGAEIIFISVHHNAGGGDRGEYIHSIYRGKGLALANTIGNEMQSQLGQQKKVYEKIGEGNKDYYHVIRNTSMDAIIVEVCFLDNAADVQIADTLAEQQRNGRVIGYGVLKHFGLEGNENSKPSSNAIINTPFPSKNKETNVFYKAFVGGRWLPEVKNLEDYAGLFGQPITAIECRVEGSQDITYRTSNVNQNYYPFVTNNSDYAGDKKNAIDRVQMKIAFRYRVHVLNVGWLSWMEGLRDTSGSSDDFAGMRGRQIDGIQIEPIRLSMNIPNKPINM